MGDRESPRILFVVLFAIIVLSATLIYLYGPSTSSTSTTNTALTTSTASVSPGTTTSGLSATLTTTSGHSATLTTTITSFTTLTVKVTPSIATTLSHLEILVGKSVTDSAVLTGSRQAGGTVTYEYFSGDACSGTPTKVGAAVTVAKGVVPMSASRTFSTAGIYSWKAIYSGDVNNDGATSNCERLTVTRAPTHASVSCSSASVPAASSTKVTCKATVTGYSPTGTVIWSQGGTGTVSFVAKKCTLSKGSCSVKMTGYKPGVVAMIATYLGDTNNQISSGPTVLTITKATTHTTILCAISTKITCTATVAGGYPSHTGTITWSKVSGSGTITFSSRTCALKAGRCSVTVTGTSGSATIEATYSGDSDNLGSSGKLALTTHQLVPPIQSCAGGSTARDYKTLSALIPYPTEEFVSLLPVRLCF